MSHIMGLYKCQSIQCHHSQFMALRLCFQLSITLCNKGGQISAKQDYVNVIKRCDRMVLFMLVALYVQESHTLITDLKSCILSYVRFHIWDAFLQRSLQRYPQRRHVGRRFGCHLSGGAIPLHFGSI